jgi:uncharacterized damage-inducible protein DinB
MSESKELAARFSSIHSGEAWHGPSLHDLLADVTAEQAVSHPIKDAHGIYELVRHIAAWEKVFTRRLEGEIVDSPEEGDFPTTSETRDELWRQAREDFDRTHAHLTNLIQNLSASDLDSQIMGRTIPSGSSF